MNRLPYELWRQILQPLSDDDIINLPLSILHRGLSRYDLTDRFQTIQNIWLHGPCLKRLLKASRHPLISPIVQNLEFVPDRIEYLSEREYKEEIGHNHDTAKLCWEQKLMDQEAWRANPVMTRCTAIHQPTLVDEGGVTVAQWRCCTREILARKYTQYWKTYRAQEDAANEDSDVRLLTKAMESLPSVKRIAIISDAYDGDLSDNIENLLGDAWCSYCQDDPVDGCGAYLMKVIVESVAASGLQLREFTVERDGRPRWYESGCCPIDLSELSTTLQRVLSPFQTAFRNLVILHLSSIYYSPEHVNIYRDWREERSHRGRITSCKFPLSDFEGDNGTLRQTMQLRDFDLDGTAGARDVALIANGTTKALAAILSSCHQVEDLVLRCISDQGEQRGCPQFMPHLPLLRMLGSNSLTKLGKLDIANFRVEEKQLVGTLLLCSSTLRDLAIDDILVDRGTWESALDSLRAKLHLLSGRFKGIYGTGHGMRALAKSYGIHSVRVGLYDGYAPCPWSFCLRDHETRHYLSGKSIVNPIRQQMHEHKESQSLGTKVAGIGYSSDESADSYDSNGSNRGWVSFGLSTSL